MFGRRRPLMRAAVVGGVAYTASKAGTRSAQNEAAEQQQQQQYAPPPEAAPAPASSGMSEDSMNKLKELADLHTQGILTDAEFEVQKQKILQGM